MAAAYCTVDDVQAFLPSGGLPNASRLASADATADEIVCEGHGLVDDATLTFRAEGGGTLPGGLSAGTTYYAKVVSPSRFQVAATAGGAAINLTSVGTNFTFRSELPWAAWIEWGARQVDSFLPPHVIPLIPDGGGAYPPIVVTANAELAATLGLSKTGGADIDLGARIDAIGARLTRWAKGLPIRGTAASTQSPVNLAVTAAAGAADPRGWAANGNEVIP